MNFAKPQPVLTFVTASGQQYTDPDSAADAQLRDHVEQFMDEHFGAGVSAFSKGHVVEALLKNRHYLSALLGFDFMPEDVKLAHPAPPMPAPTPMPTAGFPPKTTPVPQQPPFPAQPSPFKSQPATPVAPPMPRAPSPFPTEVPLSQEEEELLKSIRT